MHAYIYTCTTVANALTFLYQSTNINIYVHAYIHKYIYKYNYTYIYIHALCIHEARSTQQRAQTPHAYCRHWHEASSAQQRAQTLHGHPSQPKPIVKLI